VACGHTVAAGTAAAEPYDWPGTIDVCMRAEISHVLSQVYKSTAPQNRTVRWLHPKGTPEHTKALVKFAAYLAERKRVGVVKLNRSGRAARTLYLIPPSSATCATLGVEKEAGGKCMIALVCYAPDK